MQMQRTLNIKNMVCQRCILTVENLLTSLQIPFEKLQMGKVYLSTDIESSKYTLLDQALRQIGLEIIESRINKLVEDVKRAVREYLELGLESQQYKLSSFIASRMNYDFGYISDLFSSVENTTIERFHIKQRIEKVKELMGHDQLSLTEISYETGFSSVHHLSAQFKKVTGLTPSQYNKSKNLERMPLDLVV